MRKLEEALHAEDILHEECICNLPHKVELVPYTKLPTKIIQNPYYQNWRGTARASVADFLYGFTVRAKCGNEINDMLHSKFYMGKKKLVSRFTMHGLAKRLGYKHRSGICNHIRKLEKEGVFKIHDVKWKDRTIKVYEFGYWDNPTGAAYFEVLYMYEKFNKILASKSL